MAQSRPPLIEDVLALLPLTDGIVSVLRIRRSWAEVAAGLQLHHSVGRHVLDDKITGTLQGLAVRVSSIPDWENLRSTTVVAAEAGPLAHLGLDRSRAWEQGSDVVFAAYDRAVAAATGEGPSDLAPLSEEARARLLGLRGGYGTFLRGGEVAYRQPWTVEDPEELRSLVLDVVTLVRWLQRDPA